MYYMYKYVITCMYVYKYNFMYIYMCVLIYIYNYIYIFPWSICNNPYTPYTTPSRTTSSALMPSHAIPWRKSLVSAGLRPALSFLGSFLLSCCRAVESCRKRCRRGMDVTNEPLVMSGAEIWQLQLISTGIQNGMILSGKLT